MRSTPIVSTTPRGNVLPNDYASIGIKEWVQPHGPSSTQAPSPEPEVRIVRQPEPGSGERSAEVSDPSPTAATGPDQEVACGDDCKCENPVGSC